MAQYHGNQVAQSEDIRHPAKHLVEWYLKRGYKIVGQVHYEGKTYHSFVFEKDLNNPEKLTFFEGKSK